MVCAAALAAGADNGPPDETLFVAGVDRTWVVTYEQGFGPYGSGPWNLTAVDVATGRTVTGPSKPTNAEAPSGDFAVTDQGVIAWREEDVLYALVDRVVVVLDHGGVLTDPQAQGNTVVWTHDGAPRSFSR